MRSPRQLAEEPMASEWSVVISEEAQARVAHGEDRTIRDVAKVLFKGLWVGEGSPLEASPSR